MDKNRTLNYLRIWDCLAEAKVFYPNIRKLDPKKVSCHFVGYSDKSKVYCFCCPNRHTKFIETKHVVFLENEIVRGSMVPRDSLGSMVARKIDLEEKRVFEPTPMIQEPFFMLHVAATPTVQDAVVPAPVLQLWQQIRMRNLSFRIR